MKCAEFVADYVTTAGAMGTEKRERRKEKGERINGERGADERLAEHPAWQSWQSLRQNLRIPAPA